MPLPANGRRKVRANGPRELQREVGQEVAKAAATHTNTIATAADGTAVSAAAAVSAPLPASTRFIALEGGSYEQPLPPRSWARLNLAHGVLTDPVKRNQYDVGGYVADLAVRKPKAKPEAGPPGLGGA